MFKLLKHAVNFLKEKCKRFIRGGSMGKLFLKICFFVLVTVCSFAMKITYAEERQQNKLSYHIGEWICWMG